MLVLIHPFCYLHTQHPVNGHLTEIWVSTVRSSESNHKPESFHPHLTVYFPQLLSSRLLSDPFHNFHFPLYRAACVHPKIENGSWKVLYGETNRNYFKMPTFNIFVSIPKSDIPANFLQEASAFIAKQLGKPESYVTVRIVPDQMMCHGGSDEPCGSVQVMSLGNLGESKNKDHSRAIGEFLEKKLKISKDRFYITFFDIARHDCGYDGTTF